jgi:hypothetical protein
MDFIKAVFEELSQLCGQDVSFFYKKGSISAYVFEETLHIEV